MESDYGGHERELGSEIHHLPQNDRERGSRAARRRGRFRSGEAHGKAQWYVDHVLSWRATLLKGVHIKRNALWVRIESLKRVKVGRPTGDEIAELQREAEKVKEELGKAEGDFQSLHSDVKELGFRVWTTYEEYLPITAPTAAQRSSSGGDAV